MADLKKTFKDKLISVTFPPTSPSGLHSKDELGDEKKKEKERERTVSTFPQGRKRREEKFLRANWVK